MKIIYTNKEGGVSVIHPTGELSIEEVAAKNVPEGVAYEIVEDDAIPADRLLRAAWVIGDCCIEHDLDKCRSIGHDMRRAKRAEEFALLDDILAKSIPGHDFKDIESARQEIRTRYALIQEGIDAATSPEEIKQALA